MHDDMILKLMLFTLVKENKFKGFKNVLREEDLQAKLKELSTLLIDDMNVLNYMLTEFNFDKCLDLLRLLSPPDNLTPSHFDLILAIFKQKTKSFFKESRPPSYSDVELFVTRFSQLKENFTLDQETELYMKEIARILLQKAITNHNDAQPEQPSPKEEDSKSREVALLEAKIKEDLKLIKIARELEEL